MSDAALHGMGSTKGLVTCRSTLDSDMNRLRSAVEVTERLEERFVQAKPDIISIQAPIGELEAMMPHLDGTPLEQES